MDKETLRNQIEETLIELSKSNTMTRISEFLAGEGAVLVFLVRHPEGIMPSLISEALELSRARITNVLNSLRQKGYVELEPNPKDRRKVLARITETGIEFIKEKTLIKESIYDLIYEKLGNEKIKGFLDLLQSVLNIFNKFEEEGK